MSKGQVNKKFHYKAHEVFERGIVANIKTKGHKKMWRYFLEVIRSGAYQREIKKLRKKYGISKNFAQTTNSASEGNLHMTDQDLDRAIRDDIEILCQKFSLHFVDWEDAVFNDLFGIKIEEDADLVGNNICRFLDLKLDILNEYFTEDWQKRLSEAMKSELKAFPLAITISPYASQRDVIDYVKKMFPTIKVWMEKYKDKDVKIDRVKTKRVAERDEFIYQNRNKTGKEIKRLVYDIFGANLPYNYIPKIISREKKRRQKL